MVDKNSTAHFDNTEDAKYKRIFAGIGWPGAKPGFIAIVGELRHQVETKFVALDEDESFDTEELVSLAAGLDFFYKPERWIADTEDKANMKAVLYAKPDRRQYARKLRITPGRLKSLKDKVFRFLVPRLRSTIESGELDITMAPKLMSHLATIEDSQISSMTWGDCPALEAVAFATFELQESKGGKKYSHVHNSYDRI